MNRTMGVVGVDWMGGLAFGQNVHVDLWISRVWWDFWTDFRAVFVFVLFLLLFDG